LNASENGVMDEQEQLTENKIHIEWLVRHVIQLKKEQTKQTYLMYGVLISVIGALIGQILTFI